MADENLKKVNSDSENLKMTTREENLKKINDELEKLSDEELEKIAGGNLSNKHAYGLLIFDRKNF